MAFDQSTRNRLARFVGDARNLLTEEFTRQLQADYGMAPQRGEVADLTQLAHLDDARQETARILRETLTHYLAAAGAKPTAKARQDALDRLVREQAFTVLNRLCALRMAEARGLLMESIGNGVQSRGFLLYSRLAGPALRETGAAYRAYLFSLFDEFAVDLAVLFDRFSPQGRLFPREAVLMQLLAEINHPDIAALWAEDETIGWIYQYFNSQEERRQMRAESQAPRTSRELAVRNQFFTPRYVVEFLTDNTLGRIWYEMTRGETQLVESCRYLVRRPVEVFLGHHEYSLSAPVDWVQAAIAGDFSQMPEEPDNEELSYFSLAIDGYGLAEKHGYGDCIAWADEQIETHKREGMWPTNSLELWLILFRLQRWYGHATYGVDDTFTALWLEVYRMLRSELQNPPDDLSQEEMLNQPVFIPRRPPKDPREIKMLDPACGSMHFGLYAFDLFEQIYEEAWHKRLVPPADFGYRSQTGFDHESVRLDPTATPISNRNWSRLSIDDAYVVIASRGDAGDGVVAGQPYIVAASTQFRVLFAYRVPLTAFDYLRELRAGVFDEAAGEALVRASGAFTFAEAPALSEEEAYANFRRQIPRLIIEHNIHGIDIDPRAVQIAGLSLWLRAQRSWQAQGLKALDRPTIRKSNIVCAEPMPGDRSQLEEFLSGLREERLERLIARVIDVPANQRIRATPSMADALANLVRTVWDEMKLAGEAGSLLKIEESLADAIQRMRDEWDQRLPLFRVETFRMTSGQSEEKPKVNYLKIVPGEGVDFWDRAEALVLAALEDYAIYSETSTGYRRRLFSHDAARGFAFIGHCTKRYQVILMNPPFGLPTDECMMYLKRKSPDAYTDLYPAFLVRCALLGEKALIGAITSRSFLMTPRLTNLRENLVVDRINLLVDLGLGVMDSAEVESCAYVIDSEPSNIGTIDSFDLRHEEEKPSSIMLVIGGISSLRHVVQRKEIKRLPGSRLFYNLPQSLYTLLNSESRFEPLVGTARGGGRTFDDFRFLRLRWEVPPASIGQGFKWVPFCKGGAYGRFNRDVHLVINWSGDGAEIAAKNLQLNGQTAQARQAYSYYFISGGTYSQRSKAFGVKVIPKGCIFSSKGPAIFAVSNIPIEFILGWINTKLIRSLVEFQANKFQFDTGIVKRLPWLTTLSKHEIDKLSLVTTEILQLTAEKGFTDELDPQFSMTFDGKTPNQWAADLIQRGQTIDYELSRLEEVWNKFVEGKYGVESDILVHIADDVPDGEHDLDNEESNTIYSTIDQPSVVRAVLSICFGTAIGRWDAEVLSGIRKPEKTYDLFVPIPQHSPVELTAYKTGGPSLDYPQHGILVDDPADRFDVGRVLRIVFSKIWSDSSLSGEEELCIVMGIGEISKYFRETGSFFDAHLKQYSMSHRFAPIYWPLSTPSGSYTLWLYYHRLSDQILYTCVNDFVDPKLKAITEQVEGLRRKRDRSPHEERDLAQLDGLARELHDFRAELLRIAAFWRPNLNDGVQIAAAPLWRLFQHRQWSKRLQETWAQLEAGDYDWAHLAMSIWPARVVPKCVADRSLAIAHEVEDLFWVEDGAGWRNLRTPAQEIADQIGRRQSPVHERVIALLGELAAGRGRNLTAAQVYTHLSAGDWDDLELARLLWPERVAEKFLADSQLAFAFDLPLPAKRTAKARRDFTQKLLTEAAPYLAEPLAALLQNETSHFAALWSALAAGHHDDAALALFLWPQRVIDKSLSDPELAQVHELRRYFWVPRVDGSWRRRVDPMQEVADEVARRG